jgi:hypothetical protein
MLVGLVYKAIKKIYSAEWNGKMIMSAEKVRLLKKAVVACLNALYRHLPGASEETTEITRDIRYWVCWQPTAAFLLFYLQIIYNLKLV